MTLDPLAGLTLPLDDADGKTRFSTRARSYSVSAAAFPEVMGAAQTIASRLVAGLGTNACAANPDFERCVSGLMDKLGAALFHRPATPEEAARFARLAMSQRARGDAEALAFAFQAMLVAPQFLFRTEVGGLNSATRLAPHEIAAALSFILTDKPPDRTLLAAAADGSLAATDAVRTQARRLLEPLGEREPVRRFVREYFRYDAVTGVDKDDKAFAFHRPDLLQGDTDLWLADLLTRAGRSRLLDALLTDDSVFVRAATARNYGLVGDIGPVARRVSQRGRVGLLTQPSWLAAHSQPEHNDPIRRGKWVRESLLCQQAPALPIADLQQKPAESFPTIRAWLQDHVESPSCKGCHQLMDPIGFAFEGFDHVGRPRALEGGKPVDTRSAIVLPPEPGLAGDMKGPDDLLRRLAASPAVSDCFVAHSFQYWLGRVPDPVADACALSDAASAFRKSGDYAELIAALLSSRSFLERKRP